MTGNIPSSGPRGKFRVVLVPPMSSAEMVPLAPGLLKAYALRDPFLRRNAEIIILEPGCGAADAARRVSELRPDLAGFTVYGGLEAVRRAAREIKRGCGARVILGGPLVGAITAEEIFAGGSVDFAVSGEGEAAFAEVLRACLRSGDLSDIKGLAYLSGGGVVVNSPRPPSGKLSALPSPYLDGTFGWRGYTKASIEISRGCRGACLYCTLPKKYEVFSFKRVKDELERLLGDFPEMRTLFLTDSDVCQGRSMAPLLRLMAGAAVGRELTVELQINLLNLAPGAISLLNNRAFTLGAGVQSIFQDTCGLAGRPMDFKALAGKASAVSTGAPRAGMVLSFIMGLPGDTFEKCMATMDWGLSVNAGLFFHRLRVYPGSPLGKNAQKAGIECQDREPYYVLATADLDGEGLRRTAGFARELSLAANLVYADKYFGFLFRHMARGPARARPFPRLDLCRKVNALARGERLLAAAAKTVDANVDDGNWSVLGPKVFEKGRGLMLRRLAALERGPGGRRAFAARFAGFCEARLIWDRMDGGGISRILDLLAGGADAGPSLLLCSASSADPARLASRGFGLELLVEEKFGFVPVRPGRGARIYVDRPDMGPGIAAALKKTGGYGVIVVSQVLSAMAPGRRAGALKTLRAAARPGCRLFVIDGLLGYPEFGPDWELTGGWHDYPAGALAADLRAAGWKKTRTAKLGNWNIICSETDGAPEHLLKLSK
ncbi:MAG: radical SAM protein [Elusimicrobiota bacterium]